ncbi:MAG: alpha-glucan family phosphorylase [Betaproteobacteria bacterium]|nr:alpha-glucan family phosphorylase [Betaproteobacteria bacterium]
MPGTPYRLDVRPQLPPRLGRLEELAGNLWYSWHRGTRQLFAHLDPALWTEINHGPKAFLLNIEQKRLDEASGDPGFLGAYDAALAAYDAYHGQSAADPRFAAGERVAYFCAEFGLHESVPIYSGGLGILAGDHCKTASDLRLPFVGVGLLYRQGYFEQAIDGDGRQQARYVDNEFDLLPVEAARHADGAELRVDVMLPGGPLRIKVWRARVGHVSLYLLDTDLEENRGADRDIAHRLYEGNRGVRLEQEVVLGVGGARALAALGIEPSCWHMNEGHPAFLSLERLRRLVAEGVPFAVALEAVAANSVFTTHTAVPAGHDAFPEDVVREYARSAFPELQPHLEEVLALGRSTNNDNFNMTTLAVRVTRARNGVSRTHTGVSQRMLAGLWPQIEPVENPLVSITNGVHLPTYLSDAWHDLFDRCLGGDWPARLYQPECWNAVRAIPDAEFWNVHQALKAQMLHIVRFRMARQHARNQGSEAHLERMLRLADPSRPDVLTIGFGRRFATYKRATLLFHNLDWLRQIVCISGRSVVFLFAGKAHPADEPGQALLRRIVEVSRMPEFESRILLVEGYDLRLARRLVAGVDVWLNNPVYPLEACGTSGMKAAMNGVINLSVTDGWWREGYDGHNGWAIKTASPALDAARRDAEEARTLYELLQDHVVPLYYARNSEGFSPGWVAMAKESMATVAPRFNSMRMLEEYVEQLYRPAIARGRQLAADGHAAARQLAQWRAKVRAAWPGITLRRVGEPPVRIDYGERWQVAVAARLNGLAPEDLAVEVLLQRPGSATPAARHRLAPQQPLPETGEHLYALEFAPHLSGRSDYRLRAFPSHELLAHPFEPGLMTWI